MTNTPTIIDTARSVKNDFKKLGVNIVSTVKSARHSAGHLGFRENYRNFRKNMGLPDESALSVVRERIAADDTTIKRPGIFFDEDGRPKNPIYNKLKGMARKTADSSTEGNATDTELPEAGPLYGGEGVRNKIKKQTSGDQDDTVSTSLTGSY